MKVFMEYQQHTVISKRSLICLLLSMDTSPHYAACLTLSALPVTAVTSIPQITEQWQSLSPKPTMLLYYPVDRTLRQSRSRNNVVGLLVFGFVCLFVLMLQKHEMEKTSLDGRLGHLAPHCLQHSETTVPALLSAQQNVSQKTLTEIPARSTPGLQPTALHTVEDAHLQLSSQTHTYWNCTAKSAKILTSKLSSIGIRTVLNITNDNDHIAQLFQPWPAKQSRQTKSLIRK